MSAIAKGVRRAKSRFGGRLEPFFRLELVLYEGRSDLLTVTSAETLAGHPRLREDGPALDTAARACDAVGRLFDDGDPHAGVYHLLANELALLDAEPARAGRANALAFRLKLLLAAGFAPQLAACAVCGEREHLAGFSGAAGGVVCTRLRGGRVRARRGAPTTSSSRRSGARSPRPPPPSPRALAQAERAIHETRRAPRARAAARREHAVGVGSAAPWGRRRAVGLRLRRGLARHARAARRQGRERRGDDARAGRRARPGRLHDHHRGLRRLHEGRPGGARRAWPSRSPRRSSRLEEQAGKKLGDTDDPLLVSVRSGARESMPGMLDTVLNLGLNDESVEGLAKQTENDRFAWDSYRRFVQMFGNVARGMPGEAFEEAIKEAKEERGVEDDTDLDTDDLKALTAKFKERYQEHTGEEFPQDPQEQLRLAIRAVFDSWTGERAVSYRRLNRIPDDWGTAVNVQQMVFGNKGDESATGVAFSPRRGDRRARAVAATSSSTPRARTWSPACATRATSPSSRTSCPRPTSS